MLPSIFSIIKIGIGPSSSHTLGPIKAAQDFSKFLASNSEKLDSNKKYKLKVNLLGSLALTGKGHLTDVSVIAGLHGLDPITSPIDEIHQAYENAKSKKELKLANYNFDFSVAEDLVFDSSYDENLEHPNTLRFQVFDSDDLVLEKEYLSVGGGALVGLEPTVGSHSETASRASSGDQELDEEYAAKLKSIRHMDEVIKLCEEKSKTFFDFVLDHEQANYGINREEAFSRLHEIWLVINQCIERGLASDGVLPGGLELHRRAAQMYKGFVAQHKGDDKLEGSEKKQGAFTYSRDTTLASIYALAVSEENAAGGRIVTTPTCGAAGILPATLRFLKERDSHSEEKICESILVAGLFGAIVAHNGSIAGSEVGCQGEVGVASAMSAAAACYLQGGTVKQIEGAAETALEHHLGLTCDPVMGLVQIPCIERNAAGTVAALNAANMALLGSGQHRVSFDDVIKTMMQIGKDMHHKYKETALGGLAKVKGDHTNQC